ncbi:hypothetical protein [Methylobacter sp.]|uniref:hypothetical protein n=1 Tax=Methylobacter sp. TaxID=2051955 RepID=UPI003DA5056E
MTTYDASVKMARLPQQNDLKKHKEHCSTDPDKLAMIARKVGHQVRIRRNDEEFEPSSRTGHLSRPQS